MAPTGVACHAMPRWLTTPLAASPASFQPSNPAMATGAASSPMSLNSITRHLPTPTLRLSVTAYVVGLAYRATGRRVSRRLRKFTRDAYNDCLRLGGNEHTTNRPGRARRGGRRGHGHHAAGERRHHRRLRGLRGLQRDPERDPARYRD